MIPPVVPGQVEEHQKMVGWKNTFNMRQVTIMNLAASQIGTRNGIKHDPKNHINHGCITNSVKSLDILRRNIQSAVNKDIDGVIKKYLDKFFQPAINNIRANQGKESVTDEHVKLMCRKMLEDAKAVYKATTGSRDSSPHDCTDSDPSGSLPDIAPPATTVLPTPVRKRKESDTDSEPTVVPTPPVKRPKPNPKEWEDIPIHKFPLLTAHSQLLPRPKYEGPRWTSDRLNERSLFIMGTRANRVLGYSQTRGRLYARHPDLIRYTSDQEDKEWLISKFLIPVNGGRAYIMMFDDIRELAISDEYKNNPNLRLQDLKGFEAPGFLLAKIKIFVDRIHKPAPIPFEFPPQSPIDSSSSTVSESIQESQSTSGGSSKHSASVHTSEVSPNCSSNSLNSSQSPNLIMGFAGTHGMEPTNANGPVLAVKSTLAGLLAGHISSDNSQDF